MQMNQLGVLSLVHSFECTGLDYEMKGTKHSSDLHTRNRLNSHADCGASFRILYSHVRL